MKEVKQSQSFNEATPLKLFNQQDVLIAVITLRPHYIYVQWHNHLTPDDVIEVVKTYLEIMQVHHCPKLLNDKSDATGDWMEANDWLEFDFMPQISKAGLRCMAHIYSFNMLSQLSLHDFYSRVVPPLQLENFTEFDKAEEWLLSCDPEKSATN